MKKLECTFYRPEKANIEEFFEIVHKLGADLDLVCNENVPEDAVRSYARNLIALAKPLKGNPEMYFLGLDEPENMPSDARVDFFYNPTYYGTAIIMRAVMKHPDLLKEHENEIRGLMMGCTGRGFKGSGYGGLRGLLETLKIFAGADCDGFLSEYPELCAEFTGLYRERMKSLEEWLEESPVRGSWGEDYTEKAREVVALRRNHII